MKYSFRKRNINFKFPIFRKGNVVWFLAFVLLSLHVFFAVQTSSIGVKIALYEDEIQNLEKENEYLSINLINSTSLTKLNGLSSEKGFKKIDNTLYLKLEENFAKAR